MWPILIGLLSVGTYELVELEQYFVSYGNFCHYGNFLDDTSHEQVNKYCHG
jgi:hypothetical protein